KKTGKLLFHRDGRPKHVGQDHAATVATSVRAVAASVRTVIFPQKDLTAWIEAGGTRDALDGIIAQAPLQAEPAPAQEPAQEPAQVQPIDFDAELTRLARLPELQYEQERKAAAERLKVRAAYLDTSVHGMRAQLGLADDDDKQQGKPITYYDPEPWPEAVDG